MNAQNKENWFTLDEIKAMGNRVLSQAGETLVTRRGDTVTTWAGPDDQHRYYPVDAHTVGY